METLKDIIGEFINSDFWSKVLVGLIVVALLPLIIFIPFLYLVGKLVDILWPTDSDYEKDRWKMGL